MSHLFLPTCKYWKSWPNLKTMKLFASIHFMRTKPLSSWRFSTEILDSKVADYQQACHSRRFEFEARGESCRRDYCKVVWGNESLRRSLGATKFHFNKRVQRP